MAQIDYQKLLAKYIDYVNECEGSNFLTDYDRAQGAKSGVVFDDAEWAELQRLEESTRAKAQERPHNQ